MQGLKFRKRPVTVEAFQMTARRMETLVDWPTWLIEAKSKDPYRPGGLSRSKHEPMLLILISTGWTEQRIEPNDWIIRYADGHLEHMEARLFEWTFERVDEPVFAHV